MKKRRSWPWWLAGCITLCLSVYLLFFYQREARQRQALEEELATAFLQKIHEGNRGTDTLLPSEETPTGTDTRLPAEKLPTCTVPLLPSEELPTCTVPLLPSEEGRKEIAVYHAADTYVDEGYLVDRYGVTLTPDYAAGTLFGVVEYPACHIRRGIYIGTWEDRDHNLLYWIPTVANPCMRLGETPLTIEGHNHTEQNVSFNGLRQAAVGDEFTLTTTEETVTYEVVAIYAMSRDDVRTQLVNQLEGDTEICRLVTCGRDNFPVSEFRAVDPQNGQIVTWNTPARSSRYYDYVVEGRRVDRE